MKEHYFIVKYSKEKGWEWDTDSEANRFPDGTVLDTNSDSWCVGYAGWSEEKEEAEYVDDDDLIGEELTALLGMGGRE
jgi:hypothetical protein